MSLRSPNVRDWMCPQDCLYTAVEPPSSGTLSTARAGLIPTRASAACCRCAQFSAMIFRPTGASLTRSAAGIASSRAMVSGAFSTPTFPERSQVANFVSRFDRNAGKSHARHAEQAGNA